MWLAALALTLAVLAGAALAQQRQVVPQQSVVAAIVNMPQVVVLWLCAAPFGKPVVPEVYMMKRPSSSAEPISGSASEEAA